MSFEKAIVPHVTYSIVSARTQEIIGNILSMGCLPHISGQLLALEPRFPSIWKKGFTQMDSNLEILEDAIPASDLVRLKIWISQEHQFDWPKAEQFIKMLQSTTHRIGFEFMGNAEEIIITILCAKSDLPIINSAFKSSFIHSEISTELCCPFENIPAEKWLNIKFRDYFPHKPFYNLLTQPPELKLSPLLSVILSLGDIEPPLIGFSQVLFQPVSPLNDFHRLVELLLDIEYQNKLLCGGHSNQFAQQVPDSTLQGVSQHIESKAHNDKPFFSTVWRIGVIGGESDSQRQSLLNSIAIVANLFQHGGRPLQYIDQDSYLQQMSHEKIQEMFIKGLTYRTGFLLNSYELSGIVHLPTLNTDHHPNMSIKLLEKLPPLNSELLSGICIGTNSYAGKTCDVCIPNSLRIRGIHLLGKPGTYKTTTLIHIILNDIRNGHGVAVIDPHGDLIEDLLFLLDQDDIKNIIYLDPGDPDFVPILNPLKNNNSLDVGRMTNIILKAIYSSLDKRAWGDRTEHILRNILYPLIASNDENTTILTASKLLHNKFNQSKALRKTLLPGIDNQTVQMFWLQEYFKLNKELDAPINKLSKWLISGTVALMLSQPDSYFDFKQIMDSGKILLVNLANIDSLSKSVLGRFIIALIHLNAVNRSNIPPSERKPFHLFLDESHLFISESIEQIISETRKFNLSINVANQYKTQFDHKLSDALSTIGTSILFNCNVNDANYYLKDLQGKVSVKDLITLKKGEAITRIGLDIVKINTLPPLKPLSNTYRTEIIEQSRSKYYKPVHEIESWLKHKHVPMIIDNNHPYGVHQKSSDGKIKEFYYDTF